MITNCKSGPLACYKVADTREELEKSLTLDFVILGNTAFTPGTYTNFEGYWNRELLYVGRKKQEMYFYIGSDNGKHYYEYFHYIDVNRFFINTHKGQSGRDYNFINGKWDWQKVSKKQLKSKAI